MRGREEEESRLVERGDAGRGGEEERDGEEPYEDCVGEEPSDARYPRHRGTNRWECTKDPTSIFMRMLSRSRWILACADDDEDTLEQTVTIWIQCRSN